MTSPAELAAWAYAVECPACGAAPGYCCRTHTGRRSSSPHKRRRRRLELAALVALVDFLAAAHPGAVFAALELSDAGRPHRPSDDLARKVHSEAAADHPGDRGDEQD